MLIPGFWLGESTVLSRLPYHKCMVLLDLLAHMSSNEKLNQQVPKCHLHCSRFTNRSKEEISKSRHVPECFFAALCSCADSEMVS